MISCFEENCKDGGVNYIIVLLMKLKVTPTKSDKKFHALV